MAHGDKLLLILLTYSDGQRADLLIHSKRHAGRLLSMNDFLTSIEVLVIELFVQALFRYSRDVTVNILPLIFIITDLRRYTLRIINEA